jgi:hypothetical protein
LKIEDLRRIEMKPCWVKTPFSHSGQVHRGLNGREEKMNSDMIAFWFANQFLSKQIRR